MKKNILPTQTVSIKITKAKLRDCVIVLKVDRDLMIYFSTASRKRSELNPGKQIGQLEFSVVPRSQFRSDGKLSLEPEKADIKHGIKEELKQVNAPHTNQEQAISETAAVFDEMAVVSKNTLGPATQNCGQQPEAFLDTVFCETIDIFKIHVVCSRCFESSLKESTREKYG